MRPAATILVVVGAGVLAAEVVRRERTAAGQREPFIGIADLARRLDARRGRFRGAVTAGVDLRQPFDESFFGGFGLPPAVPAGAAFDRTVPFDSPILFFGGGDGAPAPGSATDPSTGSIRAGTIPSNTAPQDFTIAQFAAARRSGESPAVRALTRAFAGDPLGVIGGIIGVIAEKLGVPPAQAGKLGAAIGTGAKALQTAIRLGLGLSGIPSPSVPAAPGLGGLVSLSLALGKAGVEAEARARAAKDPTFEGKVELELTRMRQDPQRFFDVLADPKDPRFQDAPPEIRFSPPPSEAPAAPGGQGGDTSLGLAPAPQGETSLGLSPAPAPQGVFGFDDPTATPEGLTFSIPDPSQGPLGGLTGSVSPTANPEGVTATVSADPTSAGPQSSPPSPDSTEGQTGGTVGDSGGPSSSGDTSGTPGSGF